MILIRRVMLFLTLGMIAFFSLWYFIAPSFKYTPPVTSIATTVKPSTPIKDFQLSDADGNKFNHKSLRGHWHLLFFGYMGCPDICPKTLGIMRDTWSLYTKSKPAPVRFMFVNINPITLPNDHLQSFLHNYHPDFIGLGGTTVEIKRLSDQLGIYYSPNNDRIDHTSSLMLIDPQGRLSAVFSPPFDPKQIASDLDLLTKS